MKRPTRNPLDNILNSLLPIVIPVLLVQVRSLGGAEKVVFATFIRDLCQAYETGDRLTFNRLLDKVQALPANMRAELERALWENYEYAISQTTRG